MKPITERIEQVQYITEASENGKPFSPLNFNIQANEDVKIRKQNIRDKFMEN